MSSLFLRLLHRSASNKVEDRQQAKANDHRNVNYILHKFLQLIKIDPDSGVEEMISASRAGIADRVAEIAGHFRMRFERNAGREIAGGVFARVPIGVYV